MNHQFLRITELESTILELARRGASDKEIGVEAGVSLDQVNHAWRRLRTRTGGSNRTEVVAKYVETCSDEAHVNRCRVACLQVMDFIARVTPSNHVFGIMFGSKSGILKCWTRTGMVTDDIPPSLALQPHSEQIEWICRKYQLEGWVCTELRKALVAQPYDRYPKAEFVQMGIFHILYMVLPEETLLVATQDGVKPRSTDAVHLDAA